MKKKLKYKDVGDDYQKKDPLKIFALKAAASTKNNIRDTGIKEVAASRGESAYVFDMGEYYGAFTQEGLGTKNLIADAMSESSKTFYDAIGIDTVATIVNDLITMGARPLVVSPHWAIGDNSWLNNTKRFKDLVTGWMKGCTEAGAVYGGGETPTLQGIVSPETVELSGSAFGIIQKKDLITENNLKLGDAIILFESSGIHTNGLSMARALADRLPQKYKTKLLNGKTYGEALLTPSYIYAKLVKALMASDVDIHYLIHITGHGWRKLMRAKKKVTYRMHMVPPVQEEFTLIEQVSGMSVEEMYGTFNMGAGFACFVTKNEVEKVLNIAKKLKIKAWYAGNLEKGPRQVIIEPLKVIFSSASLELK